MNINVILAIFKRNFAAYFANPTGYVFICVFVLINGIAAFWPHEFFNANLANLDQLNEFMPFILLAFIPAITMSLWADERRQGTDELLLTIPAGDRDVVIGKYLGAVAIYSVALLFSLSNVVVLRTLGSPDGGLLFSTYVGYWLMGVGMLAIGMVASFLTSNLTVGFVLGVLFNAPLVFAQHADAVIANNDSAQSIKQWSVGSMFGDFGSGVISLTSMLYFIAMIGVGLYLSMILIGRRHWLTGGKGGSMFAHFLVRGIAVIAIAVGVCDRFSSSDVRLDLSVEKLSALSGETKILIEKIEKKNICIEVFVSPESDMPEGYVRVRKNLISKVREIEKAAGGSVTANVHAIESFDPRAKAAEDAYGIALTRVMGSSRGQSGDTSIYMGVAITSGLDKRVIPFVDRGVPTEYELVRAIVDLTHTKKKKIGIVKTDVHVLRSQGAPRQGQEQRDDPFVSELRKQYDIVEVDPSTAIKPGVDVLLVLQPSSLPQRQMDNVIAAIRSGMPAAIFEDPMPFFAYKEGTAQRPPGTLDPRPAPQMNPMMARMGQRPPQPEAKGDIEKLWNLIGVRLPKYKEIDRSDFGRLSTEDVAKEEQDAMHMIWQKFNPFPKNPRFYDELVFIGDGGGSGSLNQMDPITSELKHLLFVFAGHIEKMPDTQLEVRTLVATDAGAGHVSTIDLFSRNMFGQQQLNEQRKQYLNEDPYVLAVHVTGKATGGISPTSAAAAHGAAPAVNGNIDVVLVSDLDVVSSFFLGHRDRGNSEQQGFYFDVDNVSFGLNIIDVLAGEERFLDIRKHRPAHRTLAVFENRVEEARKQTQVEVAAAESEQEDKIREVVEKLNGSIRQLQKDFAADKIDAQAAQIRIAADQRRLQKELDTTQTELTRDRDEKIKSAESELELGIRQMQNNVKRAAVFIPPILPLLIAVFVFFWRRASENMGASKARIRA